MTLANLRKRINLMLSENTDDRPYPFTESGCTRRVRTVIRERRKAGETIDSLAADYELSILEIALILETENL